MAFCVRKASACLTFLFALSAQAQKFYTYVDDLGPNYVELIWVTADGVNTLGRSAPSRGEAIVHIAGRTLATDQLLNAVFLIAHGRTPVGSERQEILDIVLRELGSG